jgi:hypothetical protein
MMAVVGHPSAEAVELERLPIAMAYDDAPHEFVKHPFRRLVGTTIDEMDCSNLATPMIGADAEGVLI